MKNYKINYTLFLQDLAEISTGLNYKQSDLTNNPHQDIPLIQVKDIQNNRLNKNTVISIKKECIDPRLMLRTDDILFAAKGNRNFAFLYKGDISNAMPSSTFFILRLKRNDILPEYLAWYLNSNQAQDFFKEYVHGTFIPNISKSVISKMKIHIPDLETQVMILKLDSAMKIERNLVEQILFKRSILLNEIIKRKLSSQNEQR